MKWHAIGRAGERFPAEVRALAASKASGVYAIRTRGLLFTTVVYVGESHTGALYKTLTRHFQAWRRKKRWWRGAFVAEQTDPGHTYQRHECEVAFQTCSKARAVELQAEWIAKLKPRDNVAGTEDAEVVPF